MSPVADDFILEKGGVSSMLRTFTKHPSNYVKSAIETTHTSSFRLDFFVTYFYQGSAWDTIENIFTSVFEDNGCEVLGFSLDEVDYSKSLEYREFDIYQAGVDFTWVNEYNAGMIEQQIRDKMRLAGFEVIGNPDFYSLED